MHLSWSKMKHVFCIQQRHDSPNLSKRIADPHRCSDGMGATTAPKVFTMAPEIKTDILWRHPVDLFVVECCSRKTPPAAHTPERWEAAVANAKPSVRPKVVLESWDAKCNTWAHGPTEKGSVTRWTELGYSTRIKFVRCIDIGGAVNQFRLLVARVISSDAEKWIWPEYEELLQARPMSNLLTPSSLVHPRHYFAKPTEIYLDPSSDPLPPCIGATIKTDRGFQKV